MYCKNCRVKLPKESKYYSKCGIEVLPNHEKDKVKGIHALRVMLEEKKTHTKGDPRARDVSGISSASTPFGKWLQNEVNEYHTQS